MTARTKGERLKKRTPRIDTLHLPPMQGAFFVPALQGTAFLSLVKQKKKIGTENTKLELFSVSVQTFPRK